MDGAASGPGGQSRQKGPGSLAVRLRREQDVLARMRGTEDRIADVTSSTGICSRSVQSCTCMSNS